MTHPQMTTETQVAPDAATQIPASEAVETPEVTAPETATETQQAEPQEDPIKALEKRLEKERERMERRINRKHAEAAEAKARVSWLEQQLQQREPQAQEEQPSIKPEDIERLVSEKAREVATVQDVSKRSNDTFAAGMKAYGEAFKASVATVIDEAGELIDVRGMPTPLGEAILDSDKSHELLQHLAQNPELAEGLRGLSPAQLGRRIARIEADMKPAEPARSKAPTPLQPVKAGAASTTPAPGTPEYIPWRIKQLRGG